MRRLVFLVDENPSLRGICPRPSYQLPSMRYLARKVFDGLSDLSTEVHCRIGRNFQTIIVWFGIDRKSIMHDWRFCSRWWFILRVCHV